MTAEEIYDAAEAIGLSPNEYVFLIFTHKGIKKELSFNQHLSKRLLVRAGYLTKDGSLTIKAKELFENPEVTIEDPIDKFRNLFPKGILPNGRPAKSGRSEIDAKLSWFVATHNYTWEIILKATEEYVKYYKKQDFKYMQTASNFISKITDKIKSSALAEWCEKVSSGEQINEEFDINV